MFVRRLLVLCRFRLFRFLDDDDDDDDDRELDRRDRLPECVLTLDLDLDRVRERVRLRLRERNRERDLDRLIDRVRLRDRDLKRVFGDRAVLIDDIGLLALFFISSIKVIEVAFNGLVFDIGSLDAIVDDCCDESAIFETASMRKR